MHTITFRKIVREAPLLAIVSTSLLVIVAVVNLLVVPGLKQIKRDKKEFTYYQSRITSENSYIDLKQDILGKIKVLENLSGVNESKELPADISSYLENIIAIGRELDISFKRMQPQDVTMRGKETLHPILLVLNTTYNQLGQFIATIEKQSHLYRVQRIAIDATGAGKCEVKLLMQCRIPKEHTDDE